MAWGFSAEPEFQEKPDWVEGSCGCEADLAPPRRSPVAPSATARIGALVAAVVAVVLFVALGGLGWVTGDGNVERLLTETGVVGPIIFVAVMWVTQPFGVPGVVYMVPAGVIWPAPLAIAL